jgi:hypothetical protein
VRHGEEPRLELVALDAATGKVRTLTRDLGPAPPSNAPLRGLSLSPDGHSLLAAIYRLRGDLWLLDGFDSRRPVLAGPLAR